MRAIKILFSISDFISWLLFGLLAVSSVINIVVSPIHNQMNHVEHSWLHTLAISAMLIVIALGFYGLAKRKIIALIFVSVPAAILACLGTINASAIYIALLPLVFGLPYLLAYAELRSKRGSNET